MPLPLRQTGVAEILVASAARTANGNNGGASGYGAYREAVV